MNVTHDNTEVKFVPVTFAVTADTLEELKALRALFGGMGRHIADKIADGSCMCRTTGKDVEHVAVRIGRAAQDVLVQRGEL